MIKLLLAALVLTGCSSLPDDAYLTVGTGYKVHETVKRYYHHGSNDVSTSSPISARIELGSRYSDNIKYGVSHHSQWLTGFPFNDDHEYSKTEIFIDYTWELNN